MQTSPKHEEPQEQAGDKQQSSARDDPQRIGVCFKRRRRRRWPGEKTCIGCLGLNEHK
jgi:hypothetical protein